MKKNEFLAELRANLKKKHVPKISIDDALAYYDEAIHDRMEDGMSEEKAVAAMGSIDDAVQSALESMPVFLRATQRIRSDSILMSITIVLLVIGAIVWIPLTFALALTALSIYFVIWALVISLCFAVACGLFCGVMSIPALVVGFLHDMFLSGVLSAGMFLLIGGISILVIPIVARIMHSLVQGARDYVTWIAHFFVQVPAEKNDVSTGRTDTTPCSEGHSKRLLSLFGGIFIAIGLVLILIAYVGSGCNLARLPELPALQISSCSLYMSPHTIAFM